MPQAGHSGLGHSLPMTITEEISAVLDDVAGEIPTAVAVVSRGAVTASKALKMAIKEAGSFSSGGIDSEALQAVWTMGSAFTPRIKVGDVLIVDGVPSFVVNAMASCGGIVCRAQVVLCEDAVTIGDVSISCHIGILAQELEMGLGGMTPEDTQGFFIPEIIIPEGTEISISSPVTISDESFSVEKISRDARHGILCVTCRRRGSA